jgi:hypothetical protein
MRGFALYLVAGAVLVLAMDLIAPPVGLGLAVGAWPAVAHDSIVQSVNRSHKADRLLVPTTTIGKVPTTTIGKQQSPPKSPAVMVGCDPVFSPLSASARANVAGRCVA